MDVKVDWVECVIDFAQFDSVVWFKYFLTLSNVRVQIPRMKIGKQLSLDNPRSFYTAGVEPGLDSRGQINEKLQRKLHLKVVKDGNAVADASTAVPELHHRRR